MTKATRLPRTVRSHMSKRRLDMASERIEIVKDILQLGGAVELSVLGEEICDFGESLEEALHKVSLPRLRRIHARVVSGELPLEVGADGL